MQEYNVVIGLEVHAQLSTQSKMFCGCAVDFAGEPNTRVCPVCLGMPGVLPVPNKRAVEYAVKMGLATHCEINREAMWTRKNYFYPDLPKGYQITQQGGSPIYDQPICKDGFLEIHTPETGSKKIGITRIHMEEDAGKLTHDLSHHETHFDANRCGTPLIEIVSEPDLRTPQEAIAYLEKLKQILEYLEISNADMEKGNFRCDVNVSLRKSETDPFGVKVEMKNMNSFSNIEKALYSEIELQALQIERGDIIPMVTKRWDPALGKTVIMRTKEEAQDYRYFPEPDLIRLGMVDDVFINNIQEKMPELPEQRRARFVSQYNLSEYDADVLTSDKFLSDYFEVVTKACKSPKLSANWIMGEVSRVLNEREISIREFDVPPQGLAELISLIEEGSITGKMAKGVFEDMLQTDDKSARSIVEKKGLKVVSDEGELESMVKDVIAKNPKQVEEYKSGKQKIMGFFVGKIMKVTQGKANPGLVNKILIEKLSE